VNAGAFAGTVQPMNGEMVMKANRKISDREEQRRARQPAMSIARFSEDYAIGRTKAYEELKSGRLRGRKIGKRTIISQDDAEAWLQQLPALPVTKTTS
jgi:hypothetical protein